MSAESEKDLKVDPMGSPDDGEQGDEAIAKIVEHIARTAINSKGKLSSLAQLQIDLREPGSRHDLLRDLANSVCPKNVNPKLWQAWLDGGKSPFGNGKLVKTGTAAEKPNLTMSRGTRRVRSQLKKIEALKAELEQEKSRLDYYEAIEKAALHWHVSNQLLEILAPIFAMGPAWTIMRAISGNPSAKLVDEMTCMSEGKGKILEADEFRGRYAEETAKMLMSLDHHSGIEEFERRLRAAVMEVVEEFDERDDEVVTDGRRRRSAERLMKFANPEAIDGANEVLEGFE